MISTLQSNQKAPLLDIYFCSLLAFKFFFFYISTIEDLTCNTSCLSWFQKDTITKKLQVIPANLNTPAFSMSLHSGSCKKGRVGKRIIDFFVNMIAIHRNV